MIFIKFNTSSILKSCVAYVLNLKTGFIVGTLKGKNANSGISNNNDNIYSLINNILRQKIENYRIQCNNQ